MNKQEMASQSRDLLRQLSDKFTRMATELSDDQLLGLVEDDEPAVAKEAADILNKLTELADEAYERFKSDPQQP